MTEIPEHLLKRSRERRAALGLGGDEAPAGTPAEGAAGASAGTAPVPAAAAATPAPAPAAPPVEEAKVAPPKPDPPYIRAAKRRKRIPYWAMPVLAALPLWGYVYVRTLEPPPAGENDPLVLGAAVYSARCASCHGAAGGGGAGPAFVDGAVIKTWPDYRDHMMWVRLGSEGWPGSTYGAQNKNKSGGIMPAWDILTDQELAQVVLHERQLSDPTKVTEDNPDYADLFAVARGEKTFADVGLGRLSKRAGVPESELGG